MEIELPNYGINVAGPGGVRHKGYTEAQMRGAIAAAVVAEREACAQVCDEKASKMEQEAQAAEADKEDATSLRSSAWLISVCASNIRARAAIAAANEM